MKRVILIAGTVAVLSACYQVTEEDRREYFNAGGGNGH